MFKMLPIELHQALMQYLASRPYREVHVAMQELANLPDAPVSDTITETISEVDHGAL